METAVNGMKIGELARRGGVGIDTVRFYEKHGLLPRPTRTASGYRQYGDGDVARLQFVRRAKDLGFRLDEIAGLLALSDNPEQDMQQVRASAQSKLLDVERRIGELQQVRDGLQALIVACPGSGARSDCPILQALGSGEMTDAH